MLEILILISMMAGGATYGLGVGGGTSTGQATVAEPAENPAATLQPLVQPEETAAAPATEFTAEPQTPSGKFTTATEIKQIMTLTKANWIAVREWDGRDLIYFTQLESWRCGMHAIYYGVNGAPPTTLYEMEPCHIDTGAPNAMTTEGHLPFVKMPLQSVQQVDIRILYDDMSEDTATYLRRDVLMP